MEFTLLFLKLFVYGLELAAPILLLLLTVIVVLGLISGRHESWSRGEALYWSFITATTVGYGDIRPGRRLSRVLAVIIAFCGLMFTGILVALAISAATFSIESKHNLPEIKHIIEQIDD